MVNSIHTQRVADLLTGLESKIIYGNPEDIEINGRYIPPILVDSPSKDSQLMKEEIFGPVLPILTYIKPQEVISLIRSMGSPLTVYYFGNPDSVVCERLA